MTGVATAPAIRVWMIERGKAVPIATPRTLGEALEIFRRGTAVAVSSGGRVVAARASMTATETRAVETAIASDNGDPAISPVQRLARVVAAQNATTAPRCANHGCRRPPSPVRRDLLCTMCGGWE